MIYINQNTLINIFIIAITVLTILGIYYLVHIANQYVPDIKRIRINKRRASWLLLTLASIVLFLLILSYQPVIRSLFFAIVFAVITAYIINPLVINLEKRGLKRNHAILLIYLIILAALMILFILVLPRTGEEMTKFIKALPSMITNGVNSFFTFFESQLGSVIDVNSMKKQINDLIEASAGSIQSGLFNFAGSVTEYLGDLFTRIVGIVVFPIITYYLLNDKEKFLERIDNMIPANRKDGIHTILKEIDESMSQFVRGRLFMAVFVGIATTITLFIFRIDFAIVIGMITMIADIIPYIGPFLGFVPAVLMALIQGPFSAFRIGVIFILIQWVENNILGPKLIGESIGLHPLIVLLSLIVGGALFGFLGMIFAVPVISVIRILWHYYSLHLKEF